MHATSAPERGPCAVCGGPIGGEPSWLLNERFVHHRCRDWRGVPFPFGGQLKTLRRLLVEARGLARDVIAVGLELRTIERTWPAGGREDYDRGKRAVQTLRARVDHIAAIARRLSA